MVTFSFEKKKFYYLKFCIIGEKKNVFIDILQASNFDAYKKRFRKCHLNYTSSELY